MTEKIHSFFSTKVPSTSKNVNIFSFSQFSLKIILIICLQLRTKLVKIHSTFQLNDVNIVQKIRLHVQNLEISIL